MFKSLKLNNWRQFQEIDIEFHPRLTILTGANSSGKTTLINVINQHFGWNINLISTPKRDVKSGILSFLSGIWNLVNEKEENTSTKTIGEILYDDGHRAELQLPNTVNQQYQISIANQRPIRGLHIPSHRPSYSYQAVSEISITPPTRDQMFSAYSGEVKNKYINSNSNRSPTYLIKQALISLATFGEGNSNVTPNEEARKTFTGFQEILKIMLPPRLGFEKILIEVPEVALKTSSGTFSLDAVSGGVAAIIDLSWQIFMFSSKPDPFAISIDEPENHLHPELQRTLLANLLSAFPNVQFIIATHSPLMVSSLKDSNVYALSYNDDERKSVSSRKLDFVNKAASSNEILREVLDVPTTLPVWVESRLAEIVEKYANLTTSNLSAFREEMKDLGFEKIIPETIAKTINEKIK